MNNSTKAWKQYEAGKEYKRRIGLYETVRTNERFFRGDQWYGSGSDDLPKPVFNLIRRIIDYLVCTVAASDLSIRYTAENLPFFEKASDVKAITRALEAINKNAAYRWEKNRMYRKIYNVLSDAAVSGDGVFFCYWDPSAQTSKDFMGDITTEVIDNVNVFVSDVNRADIQSQDYIILSGRASVLSLRSEARRFGVPEKEIEKIVADSSDGSMSGYLSEYELDSEGDEKATYIIKFWKEDGKVVFEKSTKECVIRRTATDCKLYPVAYFNWYTTKNSFHGTSPITSLIPNQKYLNRAYAMVMKHMTDTAFSKVVYDKSKIPEWSNEIGQAIAAVGGGNIADAVSVLGVGKLEDHYIELINNTVETTKDLMGATQAALGDEQARNTSAILALQETSRIPLEQVRTSYLQCIEDLANIWVDMMCAYYPSERLLLAESNGKTEAYSVDFSLLKSALLCARIDVCESSRYSAASMQNMLDKLLDGGHISPAEYVKRLPGAIIAERDSLIEILTKKEEIQDMTGEKQNG